MERFVKGDVVVIPFPFSDLSNTKRRPALVLADLQGNDIILCQITSQNTRDILAVTLNFENFTRGSLPANSFIRPNRIFTADKNNIIHKVGTVSNDKLNAVFGVLNNLFRV